MQSKNNAGRNTDLVREIEGDDESERSDLESVDGDESANTSSDSSTEQIDVWRRNRKNVVPYFYFSCAALQSKDHKLRQVGKKYCMSFRMVNECRIVRQIASAHGFKENHSGDYEFNLMWTGKHLKAEVVRNFYKHQRVNHFPRTYELTRKDRLYKNVQRMQETKGYRNFDFVPTSFLIPQEYASFSSYYCREGGIWIVKPVALSRGRGIFLISHPDQIPTDEAFVVSRYVTNPLLIDGLKFDVRLYVVVTSFDPLVAYLYEEGLTRFATVKFDKTSRHIGNHFMHLTNYSINKRSLSYIQNSSAEVEDEGSKWTLGALLRRLRSQGRDVVSLMMKIEDVLVKTLISAESHISAACRMYVPYKENCFELFGFDIIIDENLKPWVLEVNLSPSLACDSPLDLKVKSHMLCDMFNLVGLPCSDEVLHQVSGKSKVSSSSGSNNKSLSFSSGGSSFSQRPHSGVKMLRSSRIRPSSAAITSSSGSSNAPLSAEDRQSIRRIKEESQRAGGFIRLFPTEDSWELYGSYFDSHASFNGIVHEHLYGTRAKQRTDGMANYSVLVLRQNALQQQNPAVSAAVNSLQRAASVSGSGSAAVAFRRAKRYERSLPRGGRRVRSPSLRREPESSTRNQQHQRNIAVVKASSALASSLVDENGSRHPNSKINQHQNNYTSQTNEDQNVYRLQKQSTNTHIQISLNDTETKSPQDNDAEESLEKEPPLAEPQKATPQIVIPDLIIDIENGYSLSVTQARSAFTRYLELVRSRLLTPMAPSANDLSEAESQNLDLVVRFMRRAAVNLSENVKITPPSKRLGLGDQRIFVANQMTDFLRIYKKDTFLLPSEETSSDRHHSSRSNNVAVTVEASKLAQYLSLVSEGELEKFLTHYTKVKKSASIFLGSPLSTSSGANGKNSRPATVAVSSNSQRQSLSETAQQHHITDQVWTPTSPPVEGVDEDEQPDVTLPEGIVIRSPEGPAAVSHRPPIASSRSSTSLGHNRPMSAASSVHHGSSSRQNSVNSSLAAAVAVYSAPVRQPTSQSHNHHHHHNHHHQSNSSSNSKTNSSSFSSVPANPPGDTPALASSAYLKWSSINAENGKRAKLSDTKASLASSCSDAILNAALQRIALKYSTSSSGQSRHTESRRLNHAGSMTSLASNHAAVTYSNAADHQANTRATIGANSTSSYHHGVSTKMRPQSASSTAVGGGRPPLPSNSHTVDHYIQQPPRRPRNPQTAVVE